MASQPTLWPEPNVLFEWIGEADISRDQNAAVVAVTGAAVRESYAKWYETHQVASIRIHELEKEVDEMKNDKGKAPALKNRIKQLEKELRAARSDPIGIADLEHQLLESQGEVIEVKERLLKAEKKANKAQLQVTEWKERCDRLIDNSGTRLDSGTGAGVGAGAQQALVVQKVRPLEPKRFDGVQDLEIVTRFLDEVEHYVRQGGAVCAKASKDNQHIDTAWRFLSTRAFQWFENAMTKLGVNAIPPDNYEYGITWEQVREAFKKQYVPESAVSVIRKEWHSLKFNRTQVLKFNRRALELITILGGSLTITRTNPLWEEYLQKLPEATANDISQQARLMNVLMNQQLTLSGMMDIAAERALPFLSQVPTSMSTAPTTATAEYLPEPMDLSNVEKEELYAVDEKVQCHRCQGFGHIARQCGTPNTSIRTTAWRPRGTDSRQPQRESQRHELSRNGTSMTARNQQPNRRQTQPTRSWRPPPKRVNTVDDAETGTGSYFEGGWAEDYPSEEEEKGLGEVELGGSDGAKYGSQGMEAGKGSQ